MNNTTDDYENNSLNYIIMYKMTKNDSLLKFIDLKKISGYELQLITNLYSTDGLFLDRCHQSIIDETKKRYRIIDIKQAEFIISEYEKYLDSYSIKSLDLLNPEVAEYVDHIQKWKNKCSIYDYDIMLAKANLLLLMKK